MYDKKESEESIQQLWQPCTWKSMQKQCRAHVKGIFLKDEESMQKTSKCGTIANTHIFALATPVKTTQRILTVWKSLTKPIRDPGMRRPYWMWTWRKEEKCILPSTSWRKDGMTNVLHNFLEQFEEQEIPYLIQHHFFYIVNRNLAATGLLKD